MVIEKTPLVPSHYIDLPDHVTVAVQTTDGRHFTQDGYVGNGSTDKWDSVAEKDFNFRSSGGALLRRRPLRTRRAPFRRTGLKQALKAFRSGCRRC